MDEELPRGGVRASRGSRRKLRISRSIRIAGFEIAFQRVIHEAEGSITNDLGRYPATDSVDLYTFDYGANYHFRSSGPAYWSFGVFVPVTYSDDSGLNFPDLGRKEVFRFDQDYRLGIKGAVSPWFFSAEVRIKKLLLESEEPGGDIDVDPVSLSLGIGYRF